MTGMHKLQRSSWKDLGKTCMEMLASSLILGMFPTSFNPEDRHMPPLSDVMILKNSPSCSPSLDSSWLSLAASNLKKHFPEVSGLKQTFQGPQPCTLHMRSHSLSGTLKTQLLRMAVIKWCNTHAMAMALGPNPSASAPLTSRYLSTSILTAAI